MPHKKRIFGKSNSVKYLLLPGNSQAVNADGESLETILVEVPKNHKPGTSLLMSRIAELSNLEPDEEPDLEKLMDECNDSNTEDLPSKMTKLKLSREPKKSISFDDGENDYAMENIDYYVDSQFSDASGSDFEEDDLRNYSNIPEHLKVYNAKFAKVHAEYNDDQIGPLDDEEICGHLSSSSQQFEGQLVSKRDKEKEKELVLGSYTEDIKEKILDFAEDSGDEKIVEIATEKPLEFDCESILSTYSNIYNHPAVIKEEKIRKIKIPNNPLKKKSIKSEMETNIGNENDSKSDSFSVSTLIIREKDETPEQRKERKQIIKEFKKVKRERREKKKDTKVAFKEEKKFQISQALNAHHNAGIKLL